MTMAFVWTLIIGLIAGALAKLLMPGRQGGGVLVTMVLGVAGAFLAGVIGQALGWYSAPGEGPGILMSTVGALAVLVIYGVLRRERPLRRIP
jgi:uncharacterized membrane protein YeaQ/YmgE (transglycosylase-associated protein family)